MERINVCVGVDGGNLAVLNTQMNNCWRFHWNMSWAVWMRTFATQIFVSHPPPHLPPPTHFFQLIFKYLFCIIFFHRSWKELSNRERIVRSFFSFQLFAQRMCGMDLQMMCAQCRRNRYSSCEQTTKLKSYLLYFDRLHSSSHHEIAVLQNLLCLNKWGFIVFASSGWPKT